MGIHFVCHHCGFALHVKDFQAGKRGRCPECTGSFRIPASDSSYSSPLEDGSGNPAVGKLKEAFKKAERASSFQTENLSSGLISLATETLDSGESNRSAEVVSKPVLPAILAEAKDANWFVRPPSGGQFGPAPSQLLLSWIQESRVTADSFLWREGMAEWMVAKELVPVLFPNQSDDSNSISGARAESLQPVTQLFPVPDASRTKEQPVGPSDIAIKKRMKQQRKQLTLIILLSTISLVLLGVLIFVLFFQGNGTPVPGTHP